MIKIEARADNESKRTAINSKYEGSGLELMNKAVAVVSSMMEVFRQNGMDAVFFVACLDAMMGRKNGGK